MKGEMIRREAQKLIRKTTSDRNIETRPENSIPFYFKQIGRGA